ncbi:MAG: hypothetical protein SCM11_12125 [Bacillota bacterium]|nr:hypothetical protein [Bacillota bacterium]
MSEFKGKSDSKKNKEVKAEDIRDVIARKVNDKIDRNEKQMSLAYWSNVNNIASSQIYLHAQESLPDIYSIKNINMTIVLGRIIMQLGDQGEKFYSPGSIIDVPSRTKMKIKNMSSYKEAILVMKL